MKVEWKNIFKEWKINLIEKNNLIILLIGLLILVPLNFKAYDYSLLTFLVSAMGYLYPNLPSYLNYKFIQMAYVSLFILISFIVVTIWKSLIIVSSSTSCGVKESFKKIGFYKILKIFAIVLFVSALFLDFVGPFSFYLGINSSFKDSNFYGESLQPIYGKIPPILKNIYLLGIPTSVLERGTKLGLPLIKFDPLKRDICLLGIEECTSVFSFHLVSIFYLLIGLIFLFIFQPILLENKNIRSSLRISFNIFRNNPIQVLIIWILSSLIFSLLTLLFYFVSFKWLLFSYFNPSFSLSVSKWLTSFGFVLSIYIIFILETIIYRKIRRLA